MDELNKKALKKIKHFFSMYIENDIEDQELLDLLENDYDDFIIALKEWKDIQ